MKEKKKKKKDEPEPKKKRNKNETKRKKKPKQTNPIQSVKEMKGKRRETTRKMNESELEGKTIDE